MQKYLPSLAFVGKVAVAMLIVITIVSLLPDDGTVKTMFTPRVLTV